MRYQAWIRAMLLVSTALACSCVSTSFQSTWRNPDAQPLHLTGHKVVAVFVSNDAVLRRRAEDAMAREINARGAEGVPSYTFLSDSEVRDRDAAKAKAEARGFAAAAVMRVVRSEAVYSVVPASVIWVGPPYRRFWGGYWGWGWGTVWEPGYLSVSRIVKVETLVYSLEQDQLIWAGVSRTVDPGRIESFVARLAVAVSEQMKKDGLLTRE